MIILVYVEIDDSNTGDQKMSSTQPCAKSLCVRFFFLISLFSCSQTKPITTLPKDFDSPATRIVSSESGEAKDPAVSPDGQYIYFASNSFSANYHIYEKKIGSSLKQITFSTTDERFPAINPQDPLTIAFCSFMNGEWDIFVIENKSEPSKWIKISERGTDDLHPSWSPDGTKIIYCSSKGDNEWHLKVRDLGTGELFPLNVRGLFPKWSPSKDSSLIVFQKMRERDNWFSDIWTLNFEDGYVKELRNIVQGKDWAAINPSFSPDGSKIVFSAINKDISSKARDIADDLWIVNVDGSVLKQITHGPSSDWQPVWGKDNKIYFTSNREGKLSIWNCHHN